MGRLIFTIDDPLYSTEIRILTLKVNNSKFVTKIINNLLKMGIVEKIG